MKVLELGSHLNGPHDIAVDILDALDHYLLPALLFCGCHAGLQQWQVGICSVGEAGEAAPGRAMMRLCPIN